MAVSVVWLAIYWLTPGFKGRTFKLCVLSYSGDASFFIIHLTDYCFMYLFGCCGGGGFFLAQEDYGESSTNNSVLGFSPGDQLAHTDSTLHDQHQSIVAQWTKINVGKFTYLCNYLFLHLLIYRRNLTPDCPLKWALCSRQTAGTVTGYNGSVTTRNSLSTRLNKLSFCLFLPSDANGLFFHK